MDAWRLFCDVARHHSFSAAAAEHGITQSAASQKIRALEEELGASLFDRSCRPLGLTPAGEILLKEMQYLIQRYDSVAQKISALGRQLSGNVHVTAIYSAGIELLSQARESFESQHERVSVHVRYMRPDDVYDAVRHGDCDMGIVSYPKSWRGVGVDPAA